MLPSLKGEKESTIGGGFLLEVNRLPGNLKKCLGKGKSTLGAMLVKCYKDSELFFSFGITVFLWVASIRETEVRIQKPIGGKNTETGSVLKMSGKGDVCERVL